MGIVVLSLCGGLLALGMLGDNILFCATIRAGSSLMGTRWTLGAVCSSDSFAMAFADIMMAVVAAARATCPAVTRVDAMEAAAKSGT